MADIWVFLAGAFLLGVARSLTTCALICAPGMLPYLILKKSSAAEALKIALLFSLPRILLLTGLGAVVGYAVFALGEAAGVGKAAMPLNIAGYLLLGLILIAAGALSFRKPAPAGKCEGQAGQSRPGRIQRLFDRYSQKGPVAFTILGGLISIACIGEIAVAEGAILAGLGAGSGAGAPALFGAITMLIFAIGATLPVIAVALAGSGIGRSRAVGRERGRVRDFFGVLLVLVGIVIIAAQAVALFS